MTSEAGVDDGFISCLEAAIPVKYREMLYRSIPKRP
jgi:hypothetical protein